MVDEKLVKMFNPTLKRRETILFFLIVVRSEERRVGKECLE